MSRCPLCDGPDVQPVIRLDAVPAQDGVLWPTREAALAAPTGTIDLVACQECSYVWNRAHDPRLVRFDGYDVSLQHSPLFAAFVEELAVRLVAAHGLAGARALDVGCGRGHFLEALCRAGIASGVGLDPSQRGSAGPPGAGDVTILPQALGEVELPGTFELVSCRHVVDILGDPVGFAESLVANARAARCLYVEVPDARRTFGERILWNVVYEHRSWFGPASLRRLFDDRGVRVERLETCWNGEYLGLEADPTGGRPIGAGGGEADELLHSLAGFAADAEQLRASWRARAVELAESGRRAAIWGAGARAIGLLSLVDELDAVVDRLVDVNPRRHGLHLPGGGQRVDPPESLVADEPDVIVISNPTYAEEIEAQARALGLRSAIMVA